MPISLITILLVAAAALGQGFYPRPADLDTSRYLVPEDLSYQGAFRLPAERAGTERGFTYTIGALSYSPQGDTAQDGFPGSLLIGSHSSDYDRTTRERFVARISIPAPSLGRSAAALPRAQVLQPFTRFSVTPQAEGEVFMGLLEKEGLVYATIANGYVPSVKQQMMTWGPPDLSRYIPMRSIAGRDHCYGDYLFDLPKAWADRYAPGRTIGMGRHRRGDLCGDGPAMFAMSPLADPDTGHLTTTTLMLYPEAYRRVHPDAMASYSKGGDYWTSAAFLESGRKSAVIMAGHKGLAPGYDSSQNASYGTRCGVKGFHDIKGYRPYIIFLRPDALGEVAAGRAPAHSPQPYAAVDLNSTLLTPNVDSCDRNHLNALAYDRARNLLYGVEYRPGEAQVVHIWRVRDAGPAAPADTAPPPPPVEPPRDTIAPPPPPPPTPPAVDSCEGYRQTIRQMWGRLEAAQRERDDLAAALQVVRDSASAILRTVHDLSGQLVTIQVEVSGLRAAYIASRDSLQAARAWPDTVPIRGFLERRLRRPVGSISVGVE